MHKFVGVLDKYAMMWTPLWSLRFQVSRYHIQRFHMRGIDILVFQNNKTAAMLVFQTNPVGVELFSYVNTSFCSHKFA